MKKRTYLPIFMSLIISSSALAGNRYYDDDYEYERENEERIFSGPRPDSDDLALSAIISSGLGLAAFFRAMDDVSIRRGKIESDIEHYQKQIKLIMRAPLKEDLDIQIRDYNNEIDDINYKLENNRLSDEYRLKLENRVIDYQQKISIVASQRSITRANRDSDIKKAKDSINKNRVKLIETFDGYRMRNGKVNLFQKVLVVGGALQLVDAASKVWIWGAMDVNPTYSPILTATWKTAKKVYTGEY